MDLVFNELSVQPTATDKTGAFVRVDQLLETFKRAKEHDYNKIRFHQGFESIELFDGYSLNDFCNEAQNRTKGMLLRGLFKYSFIEDNSVEEEKYIVANFSIQKNNETIKPYGLAAAYLYSVPGIGFLSEPFWNSCKFEMIVSAENEIKDVVFCVSKPGHFDNVDIIDFIEYNSPLQLIKSPIKPENKPIALRDDHGKDFLDRFAKSIRNSPYVLAIVNSLPYNSAEKNFIRRVYPNGYIEIVLTKTDKGLGMVISTTGRNKRETDEIAKILEEKYKP